MPKTKFESIIFTLINAVLMVYFMTVYNIAIASNEGLVNKTFLLALNSFYKELLIAIPLAYFFASPFAKKQAMKIVNPEKDNKMLVILSIQTFTVLTMVSLMSIYILIVKNLLNTNFICNYINLLCKNFIMAYPLQIFIVGPIARRTLSLIFQK